MNEYAATAAIVATGALVALPTLPEIGRWGYAAVTVPTGFATYLLAGAGLVVLGEFSAGSALWLAVGAALAGASVWWAATGRKRIAALDVLVATTLVAAAAMAVVALAAGVHMTRLSPDSVEYLAIAGGLERVGSLDPLTGQQVMRRLIGVALLHAPGVDSGGYMESWTPLIGFSGLALTGWLGSRATSVRSHPGRWGPIVVGSLLAFTVTADRVLFDLFYVNGHLAFATFLVLAVGMAWYAVITGHRALLGPATLGFAALTMLRPEGVIVALLFLLPLVVDGRVSQRQRWILVVPLAAATVLWYGVAASPRVSSQWLGLTGPVVGNIAGVAALMGVVLLCGVGRLRRFMPWALPAVPVLIATYLARRAATGWEPFTLALSGMGANLAYDGMWTAFWWVAPLLFAVAVVVVRVPGERVFVYPLATWPLMLLLLSYLREGDGYRVGAGDSGNRMMMHVTLVLVLYLMAAAGTAAGVMGRKRSGDASLVPGSGAFGPTVSAGGGAMREREG